MSEAETTRRPYGDDNVRRTTTQSGYYPKDPTDLFKYA